VIPGGSEVVGPGVAGYAWGVPHAVVVPDAPSVIDLCQAADDLSGAIRAAQAEAAEAYLEARRLVYDRIPVGPVDPSDLDADQSEALRRLESAEQMVRVLRGGA
jgi:hypothetical protein